MSEKDSENKQVTDAIASAPFLWGSCQYDVDAEQYIDLCKQEAEHGRDKVLAKYNIKVGKVQLFEGDVLEEFKGTSSKKIADFEADGDDMTDSRKALAKVKTVTDALYYLSDESWDLWGGAPYVAEFVFPKLDLSDLDVDCGASTGVICWLLKSYNFVEDDEPFKEWDS